MMTAISVLFASSASYAIIIKAQSGSGTVKTVYNEKIKNSNTPITIGECALGRKNGKLFFTLDRDDPVGIVVSINSKTGVKFTPDFFVLKGTETQVVKTTTGWCEDVRLQVLVSGMKNPRINEHGQMIEQ